MKNVVIISLLILLGVGNTRAQEYDLHCECKSIIFINAINAGDLACHSDITEYQARNSIYAFSVISPSENVVYHAEDYIYLREGFSVEIGAKFKAYNGPCTVGFQYPAVTSDKTNNDPVQAERQTIALHGLKTSPNPFRGSTKIEFFVAQSMTVHLGIFDLNGALIRTLADTDYDSGAHQIDFDAGHLSPGVYIARLVAGGEIHTIRLVVAR